MTRMFATEEIYIKAVKAGIVDIYCSYTGLGIGSLTADIVFDLIEAELSMNPELDDEALLDHLSLLVIPLNARPAPIFQNMTQTRYRWIAQNQPESMFRYLAGKLVFERWTHVNGHVNHGGKLEWLKTIESLNVETEDFKETLKTMIRFDAAISLRRAYFSHDMLERLQAIQNEWPGFDAFAKFVEDLESSNLTRFKTTLNIRAISATAKFIELASHFEHFILALILTAQVMKNLALATQIVRFFPFFRSHSTDLRKRG